MSTHLPWFKVYPREALSDADFVSWSLEERGAWLTLLLHNWIEGSLPENMDALARLVGVQRNEISALWTVLGRKFVPHPDYPGRITSPRLEIEREKAIALVEKRSAAGTKAVTARWNKAKTRHTKRIRNEYADDTNEVRSDTKSAYQPTADQDQTSASQPDSLWLAGMAQRVSVLIGQAKVGLGDTEKRAALEASLRRVVAFVGEETAALACAQIVREKLGGQIGALTALPGFLDRIPDAEWRRAAGGSP